MDYTNTEKMQVQREPLSLKFPNKSSDIYIAPAWKHRILVPTPHHTSNTFLAIYHSSVQSICLN